MGTHDDHLDMTDMEEALREGDPITAAPMPEATEVEKLPAEPVGEASTPPAPAATQEAPTKASPPPPPVDDAPTPVSPPSAPVLAMTGFPNPLGLELTDCHLPKQFIEHRKEMLHYVGRYVNKNDAANIAPSKNERALYQKYLALCPDRGKERPLMLRTFATAVRLIVQGRPLDVPQVESLDNVVV